MHVYGSNYFVVFPFVSFLFLLKNTLLVPQILHFFFNVIIFICNLFFYILYFFILLTIRCFASKSINTNSHSRIFAVPYCIIVAIFFSYFFVLADVWLLNILWFVVHCLGNTSQSIFILDYVMEVQHNLVSYLAHYNR